jgi:hypothetical protein
MIKWGAAERSSILAAFAGRETRYQLPAAIGARNNTAAPHFRDGDGGLRESLEDVAKSF